MIDEPDFGIDASVVDFQNQLHELMKEAEPWIEKMRGLGFDAMVMAGAYDPMVRVTHNQWRKVGNCYALYGMAIDFAEHAMDQNVDSGEVPG
jgi:hypothetical protein